MTTDYYYLHTNGSLIHKSPVAVDSIGPYDYFDSPFVRRWWGIDTTSRITAWRMLVEALQLGADADRVLALAERWQINIADLPHYLVAEADVGGVNRERRAGLRELLGLWGHELDAVLDFIAKTPKGEEPDMARLA